jgi:hypothetical protein
MLKIMMMGQEDLSLFVSHGTPLVLIQRYQGMEVAMELPFASLLNVIGKAIRGFKSPFKYWNQSRGNILIFPMEISILWLEWWLLRRWEVLPFLGVLVALIILMVRDLPVKIIDYRMPLKDLNIYVMFSIVWDLMIEKL